MLHALLSSRGRCSGHGHLDPREFCLQDYRLPQVNCTCDRGDVCVCVCVFVCVFVCVSVCVLCDVCVLCGVCVCVM